MDLSRTEYPAMLASLQPVQAIEVLNERMKHVGKLNTEVADWLAERRRVEEAYATGMRKLAQKRPPDSSSDMGIFAAPWLKFISSAERISESHHLLASKIETDIERPLRNFVTRNREVQAMSTISGNLASIAKDIDAAQKKAEKLQSKGGKASTEKVVGAASEVETANAQWESQAPYVFEKLQAVDESRLNNLRDLLTQFQTHETDQVERSRITAEECLNALLSVETADEIKLFQIRAVQGFPRLGTDRRERRMTLPGTSSTGTNDALPPLPPPRSQDDNALQALTQTLSPPSAGPDGASERSGSVDRDRSKRLSTFGGGLKRLGTVIGRTPKKEKSRETTSPAGRPELPERRSSSNIASAFSSLGGRVKSRGRDSVMPPPAEADEEPSEGFSRAQERSGPPVLSLNENVNGITRDMDEIVTAPRINGTQVPSMNQEPLQPTAAQPAPPVTPSKDAEGFSVAPRATDAITQAEQEAAAAAGAAAFGAEPALKIDIRNAPIQEEDTAGSQAAFDSVANTLRAAPPPTRKGGTIRGRRDVRTSVFVPTTEGSSPAGADASAGAATTAGAGVVAGAGAIAGAGALAGAGAIAGLGSSAGPESHASTGVPAGPVPVAAAASPDIGVTANPLATSTSFPAASPISPFKASTRTLTDDPAISDAQSVRSGRSLASTASAIKHPEFHDPGLNSSIVESVSASFENGVVTKAMTIGEVALAYNPTDVSSAASFGTESIRLDNFDVLSKVAPNPAFIQQVPDRSGYYNLNLSSITRTTVAFKYQVHQDDPTSLATQVPLLLSLQWKFEASRASAIMNYSLNPIFALPEGQNNVKLSNVAVLLGLDPSGPKASNAQATNGGSFMRERSAVYWRLEDVTLTKDAPAQQLKVRFLTDGEAKSGTAEARWEISGDNSSGLGSKLDVLVRAAGGKTESNPFDDEDAVSASDETSWTRVRGVRAIRNGPTYTAT